MAPRRPFPAPRSPSPAETFEEPSPSSSDLDASEAPPVILSPIKRRNPRGPSINKLSDKDIWNYSDAEIIGTLWIIHFSIIYH